MKKAIVTGANGFIGSRLVEKLVNNGVEVISIDLIDHKNNISKKSKFIGTDFSNIPNLINDIGTKNFDAFYNLAWKGANGSEKTAGQVSQIDNIRMVIDFACLAKQLECKKFLCAGSVAENTVKSLGNIQRTTLGMLYGVTKAVTHTLLNAYCKNIDLNFVWMQFANVYGPTNRTGNLLSYTIEQLNNDKPADFGPALNTYDFIYVDDLVEAMYRLGEVSNSSSCYFIGSGKPRLLKDFLLEIGRMLNKENLINIGVLPDDGVKYDKDMFDISPLIGDIGNFVSEDFSQRMKQMLKIRQ